MSFQEKSVWISLPVDLGLVLGYLVWLQLQLQTQSAETLDYKWVLIGFIAAGVVLNITLQIVLASILHKQAKLEDVRDREIRSKSNSITLFMLAVPFFIAIGLAMVEASYFNIVHVLYFGGALAGLVNSVTRLFFYRRGI